MDAITLIVMIALVGGALGLIFYPLWQQTRSEAILRVNHSGQTLEEHQARYQAILDAIKDLMFDYEMGKVSAEDYETLLNKTKMDAAQVRRHIDQLSRSTAVDLESSLEAEIERQIASLKQGHFNGNEALLREVEAEIELLKNIELAAPAGPAAATLACPKCRQTIRPGDTFCSHCGQSLAEFEAQTGPDSCPRCGYAFQPEDLFCARCGVALQADPNHKNASTPGLPA